MCVCALGAQLCLLTRAHMRVARVHTCVLFNCARGVPGHIFVFQWSEYVCPRCTHMCALIARVCVPGEHTCVPRVHTCVSELDTRFIVFQLSTCVLCSTCTHTRTHVSELTASLHSHTAFQRVRSHAIARVAHPQFLRGAEARSTPATHMQQFTTASFWFIRVEAQKAASRSHVSACPSVLNIWGLCWCNFVVFEHPEVYTLIIPASGINSTTTNSGILQLIIFAKQPMTFAMTSISLLGSLAWGNHMYTVYV